MSSLHGSFFPLQSADFPAAIRDAGSGWAFSADSAGGRLGALPGTHEESCWPPGPSGLWFVQGCHRVAAAGISLGSWVGLCQDQLGPWGQDLRQHLWVAGASPSRIMQSRNPTALGGNHRLLSCSFEILAFSIITSSLVRTQLCLSPATR